MQNLFVREHDFWWLKLPFQDNSSICCLKFIEESFYQLDKINEFQIWSAQFNFWEEELQKIAELKQPLHPCSIELLSFEKKYPLSIKKIITTFKTFERNKPRIESSRHLLNQLSQRGAYLELLFPDIEKNQCSQMCLSNLITCYELIKMIHNLKFILNDRVYLPAEWDMYNEVKLIELLLRLTIEHFNFALSKSKKIKVSRNLRFFIYQLSTMIDILIESQEIILTHQIYLSWQSKSSILIKELLQLEVSDKSLNFEE